MWPVQKRWKYTQTRCEWGNKKKKRKKKNRKKKEKEKLETSKSSSIVTPSLNRGWGCRWWLDADLLAAHKPSLLSVHWLANMSVVRVRWRRELISWCRARLSGCWTGLAAPLPCCRPGRWSPAGTAAPAAGWWSAHALFVPGRPSNNPGTILKRVSSG